MGKKGGGVAERRVGQVGGLKGRQGVESGRGCIREPAKGLDGAGQAGGGVCHAMCMTKLPGAEYKKLRQSQLCMHMHRKVFKHYCSAPLLYMTIDVIFLQQPACCMCCNTTALLWITVHAEFPRNSGTKTFRLGKTRAELALEY